MNFAFFLHSLASDWNHGNAHFVRGVLAELVRRGHAVTTHEQADNWSVHNLVADQGADAAAAFRDVYPELAGVSRTYDLAGTDTFADPDHADVAEAEAALDLNERLRGVDVVVVHEWTPPSVVAAVGRWRKRAGRGGGRLLFHDTHHRIVSEPAKMQRFDLDGYDGVLAFGDVLRKAYAEDAGGWGFGDRVWTWHEAADTHVFKPLDAEKAGDLCWVGNWGDDERTAELHEFLLGPIKTLGLDATVHGVRYPDDAKAALEDAGIRYGGYLPNFRAPELFARHKVTVHVPRRNWMPVASATSPMSPPSASTSRTICPLASPPMAGLQDICPIVSRRSVTRPTLAPRADAAHAASAPAWPAPTTMTSNCRMRRC